MGFISDLLIEITSFRIRVGNKLNKLWEDIGNKDNLTTTDKSNLVNAINEVNGNIPNVTGFIPYTGANQPINLNTQKITHNGIVSNVDSITSPWLTPTYLTSNNKVAYLIIDGFTANTHRQLYIEVESVAGNGEHKRIVKGFNVNFTNDNILSSSVDSRYLEVTGYTSARYGIGEVEKHSDTALKIPIIWIASTALCINKISVKASTGSVSNLTFSVEHDATSTLTTENPFLYRNASEKWVKDNYDFRDYGLGTEAVVNTGLLENINETGFYAFSTSQQGFTYPRAMIMNRGGQNYGLVFRNSDDRVGFLTGDGSLYTAWHSGNLLQSSIDNWNTAFGWGDFRDYGLGRNTTGSWGVQTSFSNVDSTYATRQYGVNGSFFGITNTYRPQGWLIKGTVNSRWNWMGATDMGPIRIYATNSTAVDDYVEIYHTGNFNPVQYVMISDLNTQLANYVPINGITTINNTKTFTSSPIVPNATLNGHAVNLGQLNTILGDYALASAIPTNNNQLINGAGYITASALGGYVQQSSLNTQLANYATLAGTQTFTGQNTFTQAPYIPAATLNGHAVNLGQLNTILGDYATEDWVNQQGFVTSDTTYTGSASIILSSSSFQRAALTGDVTASQNSNTTTIANNAVTNIKMAQMNANSIKGRAGSIGNPQDLTPAQVRTMLNVQEGANRTRIGINGGNYSEVGDINLIAGSNVSLSKSGGNITINSSSSSVNTTVKAYLPGEVFDNDTIHCSASKTIIYLAPTFAGPLNIAIEPDLQDGSELNVIHTYGDDDTGLFNINGSFINITGQFVSIYTASMGKRYRFIYVKDIERFALVDGGQI